MKFKELRKYISRIDKVSICMLETSAYENYLLLKDVPDSYDDFFVYGIGMIQSEFYEVREGIYSTNYKEGKLVLVPCLEIVLSKEDIVS